MSQGWRVQGARNEKNPLSYSGQKEMEKLENFISFLRLIPDTQWDERYMYQKIPTFSIKIKQL